MTLEFRHTSVDTIYINDGTNVVDNIPLATFLLLEPDYLINDGSVYPDKVYKFRQYIPSVKHYFLTKNEPNQLPGVIPWTDGDTYISKVNDYLAIIDNPTQDLQVAKNIKISALSSYAAQKINDDGISLFATIMPSFKTYEAETEAYTRQGGVPVDFYLKDVDGIAVSLALSDLQAFEDGLIEMRWVYRQVFDEHHDTIQALIAIEDVEAYDFETGWPATPFVPS